MFAGGVKTTLQLVVQTIHNTPSVILPSFGCNQKYLARASLQGYELLD